MILLIHPPVAKPSEPPAGIARLAGMLARLDVKYDVLDANLEGMLHLLGKSLPTGLPIDTWSRRAFINRDNNLKLLRDISLYDNRDRYGRAVKDVLRVLQRVSPEAVKLGLVNYEDNNLSPLRSADLLTVAEKPELTPFYPFFNSRLGELFSGNRFRFAGISLNYLSQALSAFSMAGFIRREFPGIKIIFGGGLVTSWMKNPEWRNPFGGLVDHFVEGPGEVKLLSLLGVDVTKEHIYLPAYHDFPREDYLAPGFILPYSASTGCYWNGCSFCPERAEGSHYRPLPSNRVVSELQELAEETNPVLIHLLDNAISPSLFEALITDNIHFPWYGFARVGPRLADPDFCIALKKAGCIMLKLGIESGDQNVLDDLQKGISVQQASTVLKNLKRAGIAAYVYLIFGTPPETEASARKTLEFTVANSRYIDFLNLAIFNMPVCGARDNAIDTRKFYEGDLSLYHDFIHPKGWDRKRVRFFLDNEFKRHPAVSRILKNDPPVFTSNHAPFFIMPIRRRRLSSS